MRLEATLLKSRLARRIFAQFVLCALLPLGAVAFFSYGHVANELTRQALERLHASCRSSGSALSERLQSIERDLDVVRGRLSGGETGLQPVVLDLGDWLENRFQGLAVVHADGTMEVGLGRFAGAPELSEVQLEHLRAGNPLVVTRPIPGCFARVFMAKRIDSRNADGGLLLAEIRADQIWNDSFLPPGTEFFAVDESLAPLFSSLPDATPTTELAAALARDAASGTFVWTESGDEHVASYRTVYLRPRYRIAWTIAQAQARDRVLAAAHYFRRVLLFVSALTFWAVLWLAIRRIKKCLHPLEQLHEATRRIAAKDLAHRVSIQSGDELQELGEAFNEMADKVLERTRQLEAASRTKNEFLANMSHEIRTPMTAILGYADLSQDPDLSPAELRQYLGIIIGNGEHLLALINDILDVSKIEAGKMQVEPLICSPFDVISDVMGLMEVSSQAKGIELHVDVDGPVPRAVRTDPTRLRQILINLIGNAVKFTSRGEVRLRVYLEGEPGEERLGFEVSDTGLGMTEQQIARIFEPFVQADASMTRSFGGTGLGLSIVRALARLLGGDITCESVLGEGSRFTVTIDPGPLEGVPHVDRLPERADRGGPEAGPADPGAPGTRGRVLLAEDVAVNRRLLKTILERAGLEVDEADNGVKAFELAMAALERGEPYGILFMDMQMPEMDGYQAVRLLRGEGYDAPIVALTSHSMVGERAKCLRAGCDEYATKPIDKEAFLKIAFRFLRDRRRRDGGFRVA